MMRCKPLAILLAGLACVSTAFDLHAQTMDVDLTDTGGSIPYLEEPMPGVFEWSEFDASQAQPSMSKGGIVLDYAVTDFGALPIDAAAATVTLRPATNPATEIVCTEGTPPASPSPGDLGQCFFTAVFDKIQIFYLGNLAAGEEVAYSVSGLVAANPMFTFADFDSTDIADPMIPDSGRDPARLVLVLDKSGSMNWSSHPDDPGCSVHAAPPPGCEPARWEVLTQAVEQMMAVAQPYALLDDEFAVALFDTTVSPANTVSFASFDPVNITALQALLAGITPNGATSIAAGLETFQIDLDAGSGNQAVLLFTDGDQNRAPWLVTNMTQVLINQDANSPIGANVNVFTEDNLDVDLCPFALRADAPADTLGTTYLQEIAGLRCDALMNSAMSIDPSDAELVTFFLQVLHETLIGDKLELLAVLDGSLTAGAAAPEGNANFTASADDIAFTVLIKWAEVGNGLGQFVLSKDGVEFQRRDLIVANGSSYHAMTLRSPFCNRNNECVDVAGEWSVRFTPFFEVSETFTYNVLVSSDNTSLAHVFRVTQDQPGVGEPVVLEATITEGGEPVTGLPAGAVRARVARPGSSLGTVLAQANIDPVPAQEADPVSAAGRKASAMLADATLRDSLLGAVTPNLATDIDLIEDQNAPGVYRAAFTDTAVEGAYKAVFSVNGSTPDNGAYTRHFETTRNVGVVADADATVASVSTAPIAQCDFSGGCIAITLQPVDAFGNLLGPGKAPLIVLPDFEGTQIEPVIDELDGRYTLQLGFPAEPGDQATLQIGDTQITIPIKQGPDFTLIALWILLILILLILVWWLVARRKP